MAAHERFEQLTGEFVDVILAREGQEFGAERARLLLRLLVALFDGCMTSDGGDPDLEVPLADVFTDQLRMARDLLA